MLPGKILGSAGRIGLQSGCRCLSSFGYYLLDGNLNSQATGPLSQSIEDNPKAVHALQATLRTHKPHKPPEEKTRLPVRHSLFPSSFSLLAPPLGGFLPFGRVRGGAPSHQRRRADESSLRFFDPSSSANRPHPGHPKHGQRAGKTMGSLPRLLEPSRFGLFHRFWEPEPVRGCMRSRYCCSGRISNIPERDPSFDWKIHHILGGW